MGNEYCCEDKSKAGDFSHKEATIINHKIDLNKNVNSINNSKKPSRTELEHLMDSLAKEPSIQKLNQNHSFSQHEKGSNSRSIEDSLNRSIPKKKDGSEQFDFLKSDPPKSISPQVPQLKPEVAATLQEQKFFYFDETKTPTIKDYGGEIYEGQISENIPHGIGRFYKKNGSFYIGNFQVGKAHGQGVFIFPDGSFYQGEFIENRAESSKGRFESAQLKYKGAFSNNLFHGQGIEEGPNHKFTGQYIKGFKSFGRFEWSQGEENFTYQGEFSDQGEFDGRGRLQEPNGVYQGQFKNGFKNGQGKYRFQNGIVYEGNYNYNKREGKGRLINPGNRIAYEGDFLDGLPHGQGIIVDKQGFRHTSKWIMGIDSEMIK